MTYDDDSDKKLLQLIIERDDTALEALYDSHAPLIYRLIVRMVEDLSLAEQLLHETFWHLWQQADAYRGEGTVIAWLCRLARDKSLAALRSQHASLQPSQTETVAEGVVEHALWQSTPILNSAPQRAR